MNEMVHINSTAQLTAVAEFIWSEADLLDRKDYDAWLALWEGKGFYTLPIGDTEDFANALNLCHDNAKMRKDRVARFQQGFSISSAPPAKTVRTLSRFKIDSAEGDRLVVRCAEHLIEDKFGRQRVWAADLTYTLLVTENGFKIHDKVARLLNSDGMLNSFSYLF